MFTGRGGNTAPMLTEKYCATNSSLQLIAQLFLEHGRLGRNHGWTFALMQVDDNLLDPHPDARTRNFTLLPSRLGHSVFTCYGTLLATEPSSVWVDFSPLPQMSRVRGM
jgi:hypothetical protein